MRPLILLATLPHALALIAPHHFNHTPSFPHSNCETITLTTTMTMTLTAPGFPTALPGNSSTNTSSGGGLFFNTTSTSTTGISTVNTDLAPMTLITLPSDVVGAVPTTTTSEGGETGTGEVGAAPTPNDIQPVTLIDVGVVPTI